MGITFVAILSGTNPQPCQKAYQTVQHQLMSMYFSWLSQNGTFTMLRLSKNRARVIIQVVTALSVKLAYHTSMQMVQLEGMSNNGNSPQHAISAMYGR